MAFVLDASGLADAIRLKAQLSTQGFPDVVNKAMKDVTLRTIQFSPVGNAAAIAADLQRIVGSRTTGAGGRPLKRPRAIVKPTSLARAIIVARLGKKGYMQSELSGSEIDQMVRSIVNARKRSVGFLKSGWLPAARLFQASAGGLAQFGPDHGRATRATLDNLFATIENDVPTLWHHDKGAFEKAQAAIQQAVDFVEADILVYVDRKLRENGFQ